MSHAAVKALEKGIMMDLLRPRDFPGPGQVVLHMKPEVRRDLKGLTVNDVQVRDDVARDSLKTNPNQWIHDLLEEFDHKMLSKYHREKGIF